MSNYLRNLRLWLTGFRRLGEIAYKPGWSPWKFLPVYLLDYGFCVLFMAGPVTSVSRYTQDHWFSSYHGAHTGTDLWGTTRCSPLLRIAVPTCWALILAVGYVT